VEKLCETAEEPFVSREALALDISRVVSRVVSGEPIDTAERGAALAAKYPELGMNAELIGQAIDRAANMVGMIKAAPAPPQLPREQSQPVVDTRVDVAEIERLAAPAAPPVHKPAVAPRVLSIDDELAAAIDAEIGNLVTARKPVPEGAATDVVEQEEAPFETEAELVDEELEAPLEEEFEPAVEDDVGPAEEGLEQSWPELEPPAAPSPKGPLAALRRAFFRR
jgi:hypothetical protein